MDSITPASDSVYTIGNDTTISEMVYTFTPTVVDTDTVAVFENGTSTPDPTVEERIFFYKTGQLAAVNEAELLQQVGDLSASADSCLIYLSGYTDASGSSRTNAVLSQKRVMRLKDKLVAMGIDERKIFFQHFGEKYASTVPVDAERKVVLQLVVTEKEQ